MSVTLILKARDAELRRWRRRVVAALVVVGLVLWAWALWVVGLGADVARLIEWARGIRI